jgi:carbon storage regulator
MLRITRRAGERIMLGDDVVIEVVEIRGGTVRLAIEAPRSLRIYREELWLEVQRENQAAAQAAGQAMPEITVRLKDQPPPSS